MMQNYKLQITRLIIWAAFSTTFISGQTQSKDAELIQVETRIVSFNVLVRDKKTRQAVTTLKREDFKLTVDGKSRAIEFFGFDGNERRPLTLILYFNLAPDGALRYLTEKQDEQSIIESLSKLHSRDEVGIITAPDWFAGEPKILLKPTGNREVVANVIGKALSESKADENKPDKTKKRTMSEAISEVEKIAAENPEKEIALVYISDGINSLDTMNFSYRKELAARLQKNNISFSALNFEMLGVYTAAATIINPIAFAFGASVTGSANYLAEQTGGTSVKVKKADEFGVLLEQIINLYSSRYGLGFTLDEDEKADGKMHKLGVEINEKSAEANKRKFIINSQRSFYVSRRK